MKLERVFGLRACYSLASSIDSSLSVWFNGCMDRAGRTEEAERMFTIIVVHSGEAVRMPVDPVEYPEQAATGTTEPVLFDSELEAADWAVANGLVGPEFSIVDVEEVL